MPKLIIVYHSVTGTTELLAKAVQKGAAENSTLSVSTYKIIGDEIEKGRFRNEKCLEEIDAADAVVFGAPTYMGGPSAQFKAFADASGDRWNEQKWAGKVASGFTVGSNPNGDQLNTLLYFSVLASQHGMIWVNLDIPGGYDPLGRNRLGTQLGMSAQSTNATLPEIDLLTANHLGKRVGAITVALSKAKKLF